MSSAFFPAGPDTYVLAENEDFLSNGEPVKGRMVTLKSDFRLRNPEQSRPGAVIPPGLLRWGKKKGAPTRFASAATWLLQAGCSGPLTRL